MSPKQANQQPGPKNALIFGGGAALGAHQVGAMRVIEERGWTPNLIVGSSIGVINAMIYVSSGLDALEEMWRTTYSLPLLTRPSLKHNMVVGDSAFDIRPFLEHLEQRIDYKKVYNSETEVAFIVTNMTTGEGEMISSRDVGGPDELRKFAIAGFSIPMLHPMVKIRDQWYADGGFAWNVPLEYCIRRGAEEVLILTAIASQLERFERPPRFHRVAERFADFMWRTAGNSSWLNAIIDDDGRFHGVPVQIVQPPVAYSGIRKVIMLLHSTPKRAAALIEQGIRDAREQLPAQWPNAS